MLFWRGHGYVVPLCVFVCALIANLVFDKIYPRGYFSAHHYTIGVALLVAAIVIWIFGILFEGISQERTLIDKETGEEMSIVFTPPLKEDYCEPCERCDATTSVHDGLCSICALSGSMPDFPDVRGDRITAIENTWAIRFQRWLEGLTKGKQ